VIASLAWRAISTVSRLPSPSLFSIIPGAPVFSPDGWRPRLPGHVSPSSPARECRRGTRSAAAGGRGGDGGGDGRRQSTPDAHLVGLRSRPTSGAGVELRFAREPTARTGCCAVPRRGPKRPPPPRLHTGGETTRGVGGRGRHIKACGLATAVRRASPVAGVACFAASPTATASTAAPPHTAVVTGNGVAGHNSLVRSGQRGRVPHAAVFSRTAGVSTE